MGTKSRLGIIVWGCVITLFAGCGNVNEVHSDQPYIVATTGMIADAAKNIGGDSVKVEALMGPGVDPHLYKATQGDLRRLTDASLVLYNGLHLEGKMGEILEKLSRQKKVIAVAEGISEESLRVAEGFAGAHDPHIWFSVKLWKDAVTATGEAMRLQYPEYAEYFMINQQAYLDSLDQLEAWVISETQRLPAQKRILVTAHDAFGYFGDTYDFEVRGLQGLSTLAEFGLKDRTDLVDFIIDNQIKAVFVETSVSERSIEAVISSCRDKGFEVTIGGKLYSDAMGEAGTPEGTYIGMFRSNVSTIISALR